MLQKINENYKELFIHSKNIRYVILMGGRSAGRSFVASQYATAKLIAPEYFRCAIMRYVLGDVRNSIFQEIVDRMEEQGIESNIDIKEHQLTFRYKENKINGIGFRKSSGDQKSKLKSLANYNCVIIEEADEICEEDFMKLDDSLRTLKSEITIIMMLNPPDKGHWIVKRWFNLIDVGVKGFYEAKLKESMKKDTVFVSTTYKENIANVNNTSIANFERYKEIRPDHYYNMIKGYISDGLRGRIFKGWKPITVEEFDNLEYPSLYGLDFGFTNDPTALIEIKTHNENVWCRELVYKTGLTSQLISKEFERLNISRTKSIYSDKDPRLVKELRILNWNVKSSEKGPGSIKVGIDILLSKKVFYTEDSENLIIEKQNYVWALDKNKEPTNDPIDDYNHLMDALRYGVHSNARKKFTGFI